jgi:hypothetical protein
MRFDLVVYLVTGLLFILLVLLLRGLWCGGKSAPATTKSPRAKHAPKPFAGLTRKPDGPGCEQEAGIQPSASAPHAPPHRMTFPRGRRRHVDTTGHFCPQATCSYHGRVGWGNIRANGHPNGRRWRQRAGILRARREARRTYQDVRPWGRCSPWQRLCAHTNAAGTGPPKH